MARFYFAEDFKAKMRELVAPLSFTVLREVEDNADLLVESLRCGKCGYSFEFRPPKQTQATAIHDCLWTHEFSWETGERCGGQVAFVTTAPILELKL